jgi:hypothetical protein
VVLPDRLQIGRRLDVNRERLGEEHHADRNGQCAKQDSKDDHRYEAEDPRVVMSDPPFRRNVFRALFIVRRLFASSDVV